MVELALAEVHNSGAYSQLSIFFCHSSEVSETSFASRSWHESNVNSFALYCVVSHGSLRAFMRNSLACGSLLVFLVCVLGVLSGSKGMSSALQQIGTFTMEEFLNKWNLETTSALHLWARYCISQSMFVYLVQGRIINFYHHKYFFCSKNGNQPEPTRQSCTLSWIWSKWKHVQLDVSSEKCNNLCIFMAIK